MLIPVLFPNLSMYGRETELNGNGFPPIHLFDARQTYDFTLAGFGCSWTECKSNEGLFSSVMIILFFSDCRCDGGFPPSGAAVDRIEPLDGCSARVVILVVAPLGFHIFVFA